MQFSEDDLRSALRKQEPSPDFTSRVMAGIGKPRQQSVSAPRIPAYRNPWRIRWALAGALAACLLVTGTSEYRAYRRRVEGQEARQQAVRAIQITADKMEHVFRHAKLTAATSSLERGSADHKEHL